jgi:hypothetical protein
MTLETVIGNLDETLSSLFIAAHTIFVASTYFLGDTHTYVSLDIPITRSVFPPSSPRFPSSFAANAECNDASSSFNVVSKTRRIVSLAPGSSHAGSTRNATTPTCDNDNRPITGVGTSRRVVGVVTGTMMCVLSTVQ